MKVKCTVCSCVVDEHDLCEYSDSICEGCCDTCSDRNSDD